MRYFFKEMIRIEARYILYIDHGSTCAHVFRRLTYFSTSKRSGSGVSENPAWFLATTVASAVCYNSTQKSAREKSFQTCFFKEGFHPHMHRYIISASSIADTRYLLPVIASTSTKLIRVERNSSLL